LVTVLALERNKFAKLQHLVYSQSRELPDVLWILDRMKLACPKNTHSNFWIEPDQELYTLRWKISCKDETLSYAMLIDQRVDKNTFYRKIHQAGNELARMYGKQYIKT